MNAPLNEQLTLVRRVAGRIARRLPAHVQLDDLVSAGTEGLLDATRRFDPAKGVAFGAYAEIRIRGAVMDELRQHDFVPRSVRRRRRQFDAAKQQAARAGSSTEDDAISLRLGIKPEALQGWLADGQLRLVSTDAPDAQELSDERPGTDVQLEHRQELGRLGGAVSCLSERLQTVLSLYYVEDLTLKEIGAALGVTESRVCQLHSQAVAKLREQLEQGEDFAHAA